MDEKDKIQILLKEYEICHEDSNALGSRFWSFANIFIPINLAVLGLLLSAILDKDNRLNAWIILIIGVLAIGILICVILWFKRTNCITGLNYERAREIEIMLGIWKNRRLHALDHFIKKNDGFDTEKILPDIDRMILEYQEKEWWQKKKGRFTHPHIGQCAGLAIFIILILLWFVVIIFGVITI
jgi:hypothetical protein